MRLLLDENLPKKLKIDFGSYEIYTVREKMWNGIKNGELIRLLIDNGFNALLTFDKNLQHQQNLYKYPMTVFVISANKNTYSELTLLTPQIKEYLNSPKLPMGPILIKAKG